MNCRTRTDTKPPPTSVQGVQKNPACQEQTRPIPMKKTPTPCSFASATTTSRPALSRYWQSTPPLRPLCWTATLPATGRTFRLTTSRRTAMQSRTERASFPRTTRAKNPRLEHHRSLPRVKHDPAAGRILTQHQFVTQFLRQAATPTGNGPDAASTAPSKKHSSR